MLDTLLRISRSSMDRCLAPSHFHKPHGLSTTKPGILLKKNIPIRTFTNWNEEQPGFLEIDLVAHCGGNTAGQYLYTLDGTDLCTGWTKPVALPRHTQEAVGAAMANAHHRILRTVGTCPAGYVPIKEVPLSFQGHFDS